MVPSASEGDGVRTGEDSEEGEKPKRVSRFGGMFRGKDKKAVGILYECYKCYMDALCSLLFTLSPSRPLLTLSPFLISNLSQASASSDNVNTGEDEEGGEKAEKESRFKGMFKRAPKQDKGRCH
jgi:hypothetical protein